MVGPTVDLLVIGGGPVGLATALEARRVGLSVVVVEPRATPVDKACGEGLMPSAVNRLAALGVVPNGRHFLGITYVGPGGHRVTADFPDGSGLGVRRLELHESLSKAVAGAGVEVVHGTGRVVAVRPTHVEAEVDGRQLSALYVAAADGLHSSVREGLGLGLPPRGRPRYGLRQHFAVTPWADHVEVHWSDAAELYVTPVTDGVVGVAVLTAVRGRSYASWLEEFPEVAQRLSGAEGVSEVRGAGPLEQRTRRRTAGRVLLVGDAAGYVDAITGEGFAVGLAAAEALARAVRADDPLSYERAWTSVTRRSRLLTLGLLKASQVPSVRDALVPAAERFPRVFARVVAALA
jgi:flavin-dependent dehydrogenase